MSLHIIKVQRKEDLRNLNNDKKGLPFIAFFLEFPFNMTIVKYIFYFIIKNTQKFSQINDYLLKNSKETYTYNLNRKPFSFSFVYLRVSTSLFIYLKIIT